MKFRLKKLNFPNQRDIGDEITWIINILKREKNLNIKADVNKSVRHGHGAGDLSDRRQKSRCFTVVGHSQQFVMEDKIVFIKI